MLQMGKHVGKHKSKSPSQKDPDYMQQAQERRSARHPTEVSQESGIQTAGDTAEGGSEPMVIDNNNQTHETLTPGNTVPLNDAPVQVAPINLTMPNSGTSTSHRSRSVTFATNNHVANDQIPSTSSTVQTGPVTSPTRDEFLALQEQIAMLTATINSMHQTRQNSSISDYQGVSQLSNNMSGPRPAHQPGARSPNMSNVSHSPPNHSVHGITIPSLNVEQTGVPSSNIDSSQQLNNDHMIQQVVDAHAQSLMDSSSSGELGSFEEAARAIDLKVPDSIKQAIWANQYVDINKLVPPKTHHQIQNYEWVSTGGQPPILAPASSRHTITTIGPWCDAFLVYLTIYCAKYPSDLSKLTSYMSTVKLLNSKNGDFLYYDQEFRYLRYKRNIPWDEVHSGLWLECKERGPPNQGRNNNFNKPRNNNSFRAPQGTGQSTGQKTPKIKVPYGFCFAFHNKGECKKDGCTYLHKCFAYGCTGSHPITQCPNAKGGPFEKYTKGAAGGNSSGNSNKRN